MKSIWLKSCLIVFASFLFGLIANHLNHQGIHRESLMFYLFDKDQTESAESMTVFESFPYLDEPNTLFLDIRPYEEYAIDHIAGAVSLYPARVIRDIALHADKEVYRLIVYDFEANSPEARLACKQVKSAGFSRVFILEGGFASWLEMGFPVEEGSFL